MIHFECRVNTEKCRLKTIIYKIRRVIYFVDLDILIVIIVMIRLSPLFVEMTSWEVQT